MFLYFSSVEIKKEKEQLINPVSKLTEKDKSLPLKLAGKRRGSRWDAAIRQSDGFPSKLDPVSTCPPGTGQCV